jgi:hypothetical protein
MLTKIIISIFVVTIFLLSVYLFEQSVSWQARTEQEINVYSSEFDAAYESAFNRPNGKPLLRLTKAESVDVLSDTYGKDYWACYVRTSKGIKGWVLCTALKKFD